MPTSQKIDLSVRVFLAGTSSTRRGTSPTRRSTKTGQEKREDVERRKLKADILVPVSSETLCICEIILRNLNIKTKSLI